MTSSAFEIFCGEYLSRCEGLMAKKEQEYSKDLDRFHNFKAAGAITGDAPIIALRGMLVKHVVSVFDMLADYQTGVSHPVARWDEKIQDNICYLVLLAAMLSEETLPN